MRLPLRAAEALVAKHSPFRCRGAGCAAAAAAEFKTATRTYSRQASTKPAKCALPRLTDGILSRPPLATRLPFGAREN